MKYGNTLSLIDKKSSFFSDIINVSSNFMVYISADFLIVMIK